MFPQAAFAPIGQVSSPVGTQAKGKNKDVYLFDLEVLTSSPYGQMDHSFADYLSEFLKERQCFLLTRSSFNDACTRLPRRVLKNFAGVFASCGTELWIDEQMTVCHDHAFSDDLYEFLVKVVHKSSFYDRSPPLIDQAAACLRICLAGVRASAFGLRTYETWEDKHQELPVIISEFQFRFPQYTIYRDTKTSLLILPNSFSPYSIRDYVETHQGSARMIGYLHKGSALGFAKPLCDGLRGTDVLSEIVGPSDVSQLMSYEVRRMTGKAHLLREPETSGKET